jgi:2-dehydro-3-deoxyglucarate aldolase/4-hydroxy-2-oxoheptanedioate aldolase
MDLPINHFKRAIASGKTPIGAWLVSSAPSTAEALGCAGFDFLVVDMEHTPIDTPQMVGILQTIAGTPAQAIVRPPWNDMAAVRGVAAMRRGSRYGAIPNYAKRAHEELCVIVQIETMTAFAQLEAIAAVPGVDSIFIGPADLSASMGFLGDMGNPAVQDKLSAGAQTCKRLGKPCGIVGANPDIVGKFLEYGFSWVAVGSDLAMLVSRAQEYLSAVRKTVDGAPSKA